MRVIKPIDIELVSSNVPDSSATAWDAETSFTAGKRVLVTTSEDGDTDIIQKEYIALRDNIDAYPPDNIEEISGIKLAVSDTDDASGFTLGEMVSSPTASGYVGQISGTTGGYIIVTSVTGTFVSGDTVTGADSELTATVDSSRSSSLSAAWEDAGATNRWKMFDTLVNSQTESDAEIDVTISCDRCDTLVLLDLECASITIDVTNDATGELVFSSEYDMRQDESVSWSDYFFTEAQYKTTLCVSIPLYNSSSARILISNDDSTTKCGHVVAGRAKYLGPSQWSPTAGITDYSTKSTDDDGVTTLEQGEWAKEVEVALQIESTSASALQRRLAGYRGLACVWDCNNDSTEYDALILYGYYSDFSIVISGPVVSACSMTIQGLI